MRVAMRHDGRPGAVESIGDRRVALHGPLSDRSPPVPVFASIAMPGRALMHLAEGCAPVETVIGLLRPDVPQLHKLHKSMDAVDAKDLVRVCTAWGFDVQIPILVPLLQEN